MSTVRTLPTAQAAAYGVGSFGTGVFSTVPTILLLYYCTETLAMATATASLLILFPKICSMVWDPFVGLWSDSHEGKAGRRRPFMLIGACGVSISFALLFASPPLSPTVTILWVGIAYFVLTGCYTLFAVPYSALPAELATTEPETARLVAWRMGFVMAGVIIGAAVAPTIVTAAGGGRSGYAVMGALLGITCLAAILSPVVMLSRWQTSFPASQIRDRESLWPALAAVWSNRPFRRLALGFLMTSLALGCVSAALPYVVTRGLGRGESDIGIALAALLGTTVVAVPVWAALGRRIGYRQALWVAAIGYGAAAAVIGLLVLTQAPWALALASLALAGIPFAGLQLLPFTISANLIRATAPALEGRYTGVWIATEKLGLAGGSSILGLFFALTGSPDPKDLSTFLFFAPPFFILFALFNFANAQVGKVQRQE
jgi:GPH family glycoside/pentoside/hexuronide:cation symporter